MFNAVSTFNGIVKVEHAGAFYVAHQNGVLPDGSISTSHAFAQLVIQRLGDA
jgi:hypothetical protein